MSQKTCQKLKIRKNHVCGFTVSQFQMMIRLVECVCVSAHSNQQSAISNRQLISVRKYKGESLQRTQFPSTTREQLWFSPNESAGLITAEEDIENSSASG